tara:strand:- start:286 stop:531 length:246 start_codon:yes stop_codon:yes gene_type:complete
MKKGFNNVTASVQEIWAIENLSEAKEKLISLIENDLYKSTKIKKYNLVESVKKAPSKRWIDKTATTIMFQDSKFTSSFQNF